jgi:MFS family permease
MAAVAGLSLPIRRNTLILSATMAVNSAVLQLVAAVSSLTFVLVTGVRGLLGLGPAIFLTASGLTSVPAGRLMDRFGRTPVMTGGFAVGALGCGVTALATHSQSTSLVIVGFGLIGMSSAVALLIRTAAGDMYPPARRARGISYVLFGSVFGAILGPTVFSPMFAGKDVEADALTVPWLAAGGIALVALVLVQFVRPDPKRIAELIGSRDDAEAVPATSASLAEIIRRPGVIPAMLAALASFGAMVSVMNLSGYVVVEHHHHGQESVFPIIGAHVFGMYALVLVIGAVIDTIGRKPALEIGLVVMAVSTIGMLWVESVFGTAVLLFLLGVGWNISFVSATAEMADRTSPAERGKLLGFNDLLAAFLAAGLALLGGYALDAIGVAALAIGATAIVVAPILLIARPVTRVAAGALVVLLAFSVAAQARPQYRQFKSRPDLKPPRIKLFARTRFASPGYVFIAPKKKVEQAGPLILDNRGRVVWFLPVDHRGVTDFRAQRYRGKPVLTWWRGKSVDGERRGHYTIYDNHYKLIKHIRPGNDIAGDMHEFFITKRNTALVTLSHIVRVKTRKVLEGALQEIDIRTGRVLFEWHSVGNVALVESYYRLPRDPDKTYDYFHINSIDIDHDGNLLVSARNTHAIYKINRRTGKIIWRLGGRRSDFELGKGVRFGWQHDARRRPDGTLTLFDNAAAPKLRKQSRGLVLRLDERRMRADLLHTYVHDPPIVAVDQGNMQKLPNGNFLIGWGHEPFVTEFGPQGKAALDFRFDRHGVDSYRAYKFSWIGRPARKPAVAVERDKIYVSWNGATEVVDWQLLGGSDKKKLRPLSTVPKEGFETAIPLPSDVAWVAVRALDRKGRSMARSAVVGRD